MKGERGKSFVMSEFEYAEGNEESMGRCIKCGAEAYGVEPDARAYTCEACGENAVYGLEELLLMGLLEVVPEEEEG